MISIDLVNGYFKMHTGCKKKIYDNDKTWVFQDGEGTVKVVFETSIDVSNHRYNFIHRNIWAKRLSIRDVFRIRTINKTRLE